MNLNVKWTTQDGWQRCQPQCCGRCASQGMLFPPLLAPPQLTPSLFLTSLYCITLHFIHTDPTTFCHHRHRNHHHRQRWPRCERHRADVPRRKPQPAHWHFSLHLSLYLAPLQSQDPINVDACPSPQHQNKNQPPGTNPNNPDNMLACPAAPTLVSPPLRHTWCASWSCLSSVSQLRVLLFLMCFQYVCLAGCINRFDWLVLFVFGYGIEYITRFFVHTLFPYKPLEK
jgi:hypothetical protein